MRRLLVLLAGLGVLPAATGCKHTAGLCDCQGPVHPCNTYGLYPADFAPPPVAPVVAPATAPTIGEPPVAGTPREQLGAPREGI